MVRALIVHLSLGGTTARVARHIADGLREAGLEVTSADLLTDRAEAHALLTDPERPPDLLGVGAPAHYFRVPEPVAEYLGGLPRLDSLSTFTFALFGTYPGAAITDLQAPVRPLRAPQRKARRRLSGHPEGGCGT